MSPDIHVIPINDLREHVESRDCWCEPLVSQEAVSVVVVHHSMDGRELVEAHGVN